MEIEPNSPVEACGEDCNCEVGDRNSPHFFMIPETQDPQVRPLLFYHSITHVKPAAPNPSNAARLDKDHTVECLAVAVQPLRYQRAV